MKTLLLLFLGLGLVNSTRAANFTLWIYDDSRVGGLPAVANSVYWAAPGNPYPSWTGYNWDGQPMSVTLDVTSNSGSPRTVSGVKNGPSFNGAGGAASITFSGVPASGSIWTLKWTVIGVHGAPGTGWQLVAGAPSGTPQRLDKRVCNNSLRWADFTYSMTDSLGNSYTGAVELAPGACFDLELTVPAGATPGTVTVIGNQRDEEGTVVASSTDTYTAGEWTVDGSTPPEVAETAPVPQPPTDTTSKTTPSIDYGTSTGAASESSLKTGLASIRTAIAETSASQIAALGSVNSGLAGVSSAVTAGASAVAGEVSDASDLAHADSVLERGLLEEIRDEAERGADGVEGLQATNLLAKTILNDSVGTWGSQIGTKAAVGTGDITDEVTTGAGRFSSAGSALSFSPSPSLWQFDFGPLGEIDLNPRQLWPPGSAVNDIRIWGRAFAFMLIIGYGLYCAAPRALEAMHRVADAQQLQAPTGAEGLVSFVSIPSYVAVLLSLYTALSIVIMAAWASLFGGADWSLTSLVLPATPAEIASVFDAWFPLSELWPLLCGYAVFRLTVGASAAALAVARSFLPV